MIAFMCAVAFATTIAFALAPSLSATRPHQAAALRNGGRGIDRGQARLQRSFVVAQLALSMLLLALSGIFLGNLRRELRTGVGFEASHGVLMASIALDDAGYTRERAEIFLSRLRERVRALPAVEGVSFTSTPPFVAAPNYMEITVDDTSRTRASILATMAQTRPGYFDVLEIPVLRGRDFTSGDVPAREGAVVVSESFAARAWPGADPLDQVIRLSANPRYPLRVVGVVRDARMAPIDWEPAPMIYLAERQNPRPEAITMLVRAADDARPLGPSMQQIVNELDKSIAVEEALSLADARRMSTNDLRFFAVAGIFFGSIALLLTGIGVYAVTAFTVAQRSRDVGIRMAVGALARQITRSFVRQGLKMTAIGTMIGGALAFAIGNVISATVFGINGSDIVMLGIAALLLGGVTIAASWIPARRASGVDPLIALRAE